MSVAPAGRETAGAVRGGAQACAAGGIAAVVVSHRSASTLDDCLLRLRGAHGVTQIRVVDNASDDDTLEIVQRHALADPRLRFIANPDNPGFAVACNQGAAASDAPWLAFVNPDLRVKPDSLQRLRAHAATLQAPALLGADLLGEDGVRDGAARRRDPDFAGMLSAILGSPSTAARLDVAMDATQALQPVQAVSGALMLMPRALFEGIGGFDEGYRLHAEDLDLCRRARLAGATVAVANDVSVVHVRGVSSRSRPLFVEWHKHRGLWRYFTRFEATHCGIATRAMIFAAIWAHFAATLPRALRR